MYLLIQILLSCGTEEIQLCCRLVKRMIMTFLMVSILSTSSTQKPSVQVSIWQQHCRKGLLASSRFGMHFKFPNFAFFGRECGMPARLLQCAESWPRKAFRASSYCSGLRPGAALSPWRSLCGGSGREDARNESKHPSGCHGC